MEESGAKQLSYNSKKRIMIENFKGKENTNGLDKNPDHINKEGRPPSFKTLYKELINEDSEAVIWSSIEPEEKQDANGNTLYGFRLTRLEKLLARLDQLASGTNDRVALDAIKFLWEQLDGKSTMKLEMDKVPVFHVTEG